MVFKLSKSKEGSGSGSKEKGSKESRSKEKGSKEKGSKESRSKEKGSKESKSKESRSKEKGSKEKESKEREREIPKKQPNVGSNPQKINLRFLLIIIGICVIILILIMIAVVLYFVLKEGSSDTAKIERLPPVLCTSSVCKKASNFLKKSAKFSVNPCTDFYEHVCGNYKRETSIAAERNAQLQDLMKKSINDPKLKSSAMKKIKKIYKVCMESDGPLMEEIVDGNVGKRGWPVIHDVSNVDITDVLIEMLKVTSDVGIFKFDTIPIVDTDTKESRMIVILSPSILKPGNTNNFETEFLIMAEAAYKAKYPKESMINFKTDAIDMFNLYIALKNFKTIDINDGGSYRHPLSRTINWKRIARSLSRGLYHVMYDPSHLDAYLEKLLSQHKKEAFLNLMYFAWFRNTVYSPMIKNDACDKMMFDLFPGAFSFFYLYANVDLKNRDEIIKMANNIRESTIEVIMESKWIDEATKKIIAHKLKAMKYYIGYDDLYENIEELEKLYRTLRYTNPTSFFEMVQDVQKWEIEMMYDVISGKKKEEFAGAMLTVNAMYSTDANILYVALGHFSPPSYHRDLPVYSNYGGVGRTIAHEIGHSIGPSGHERDYSGLGKTNSDPKYTSTMKRLTSCLGEYYSNRYNINGTLTLEENSADVIGIRTAFRSMKKEAEKLKQDILLPGFETKTNEQMFFYLLTATWCENEKNHHPADFHAPSRARVNGPLSLSEEFAKAFQCKEGTNMNPVSRCDYYGD